VGAIVAAALLWGLLGPDKPIRVSRETTFLTEPLAADGLPDYRAAMLAAIGPAPKPADNAAVEHLQVMWPLSFEEADLPMVCKALGIPNVAPADLLQCPTRWAEKKVKSEDFSASETQPWTPGSSPTKRRSIGWWQRRTGRSTGCRIPLSLAPRTERAYGLLAWPTPANVLSQACFAAVACGMPVPAGMLPHGGTFVRFIGSAG
jgi:hypothetical protein